MRVLLTAVICASIGIGAYAAQGSTNPVAAKCSHVQVRFPDAPEHVYVFDARSVDPDSLLPLDRIDIESVDVVCADYIYDTFGIKARRSGVVIFSAPGPYANLGTALDSIAVLQSASLTRTGHFASTLSELGWNDATDLISIDLSVAEEGARWTATGSHKYLGRNRAPAVVGGSRDSAR